MFHVLDVLACVETCMNVLRGSEANEEAQRTEWGAQKLASAHIWPKNLKNKTDGSYVVDVGNKGRTWKVVYMVSESIKLRRFA